MVIDRSNFLALAAALAVGGVAGWYIRDARGPVLLPVEGIARAEAVVVKPPPPPKEPACSDDVGSPGECPAFGPAEEGVCSNVAAQRCRDFKESFKPKVAEAAVACIHGLKAGELCDPKRVNLCGHAALMAACPVPNEPTKSSSTDTESAGSTKARAAPSVLAQACESITKSCTTGPAPTVRECEETLSGLNDVGRARMTECMKSHCGDRGLIGCEAMNDKPQQAAPE
jgi:hypothetical protein